MTHLLGPDAAARRAVEERASEVLRPAGALWRLDEVAAWLAGWQRTDRPAVRRPALAVFAADHGVCVEGVSAYPSTVTAEVAEALRAGCATAAVMAAQLGVRLIVEDVGIGRPSGNLAVEEALSVERFQAAFAAGSSAVDRLVDDGADLLLFGEMGIGNTTAASAVAAALFGGPAEQWIGRGTGIDDATLERKVGAVRRAVARLPAVCAPLEKLRHVGGGELVAIAGAVQRARERSMPVLLDGFIVTAAAAPLAVERTGALDHCLAGHCSAEPGHRLLLAELGLVPLLDLDLRLGEGTGALAALPLVRLAAAAVTDVATFAEWDAR